MWRGKEKKKAVRKDSEVEGGRERVSGREEKVRLERQKETNMNHTNEKKLI